MDTKKMNGTEGTNGISMDGDVSFIRLVLKGAQFYDTANSHEVRSFFTQAAPTAFSGPVFHLRRPFRASESAFLSEKWNMLHRIRIGSRKQIEMDVYSCLWYFRISRDDKHSISSFNDHNHDHNLL